MQAIDGSNPVKCRGRRRTLILKLERFKFLSTLNTDLLVKLPPAPKGDMWQEGAEKGIPKEAK